MSLSQLTCDEFCKVALQASSQCMSQSQISVDDSIASLKEVHKAIKELKERPQNDRAKLEKLETITMTNLACLYRKKLKFSVALYYLKNVQMIQQRNQYSDQDLGSTHSNLCAVFSEMGRHDEALKEITIGLEKLQSACKNKTGDQRLNRVNLIIGYHNYAIESEFVNKFQQGIEKIEKALQEVKNLGLSDDIEIVIQLKETLTRLTSKKDKVQKKFSNFYKNQYRLKTYFKNRSILDETFIVTKSPNNKVAVDLKLPNLTAVAPFPTLFLQNSRSKSKSFFDEISQISAYRARHASQDTSALRIKEAVLKSPRLENMYKTGLVRERSLESTLLEYADDKKKGKNKTNNFRKNRFVVEV